MPLFDLLTVFADATPRGGAEQMALDEALLETCDGPVLRVYRWDGPAVSFGYSQSLAEVVRAFPGLSLVRRWTGGGMVEHGRDWTFSLVVPAGDPFVAVRPAETYRRIHAAVAEALGGNSHLKPDSPAPAGAGGACFVRPVCHDILALDGRKVCGGAQRRTRRGFLHQGSVQDCAWPSDMTLRVAARLSERTEMAQVSTSLLAKAKILAVEKYSSAAWREKV